MWSLNNIANKAAEALNSAKKGISDMAKELPPETSPETKTEVNLQAIKKQALVYRKKIEQQSEEISSYKNIIEEMMKEKNNLINFKIIIGHDNSAEDSEKSELQQQIERFSSENKKLNENLTELVQKNKELSEKYEVKIRVLGAENENWELKCVELQGKLNQCETLSNSYNENLQKYKQRVQKSISEIYSILKASFDTLGLVIPYVRIDQLGLEDLQEFIFTQSKYFEDSLQAFNNACIGLGKEGKTLEDFKNIFISHCAESSQIAKLAKQKMLETEAKIEKIAKEKEELFKINSKKDERIKLLIEQISKSGEEVKLTQELKDENPRLQVQVKELLETTEKLKKNNESLKENLQFYEQKLKKSKEKVENLLNSRENLNKRLKILNSSLSEKESQFKTLQEAASILQSELNESKQNSDKYKKASEKNLSEVNTHFLLKIKEAETIAEKKMSEVQKKLKDTQNELKDKNLENIQLLNKLRRMEELEKNLGYVGQQNSTNLGKIDRLTIEKETLASQLKEKDQKILILEDDFNKSQSYITQLKSEFLLEKEGFLLKIKESETVKQEAENLLKRVEQESMINQTMIDKRVVTTFLINYTNEKYNAKAKVQMLKAISEMLGMTPEERQKLGIFQELGFFSQFSGYLRG